jgi:hypothetical protein
MGETRIKNYRLYIQRLEKYAKSVNIRVVRSQQDGDGEYDTQNSVLYIDPDLDEDDELSTFIHELGHAFDYMLSHKKLSPKIWRAYEKVYYKKPNQEELDTVVEAEVRAWEIGKLVARRLKIPLGKWYAKARKSSLLNYRSRG